jgi:hypothetical protein
VKVVNWKRGCFVLWRFNLSKRGWYFGSKRKRFWTFALDFEITPWNSNILNIWIRFRHMIVRIWVLLFVKCWRTPMQHVGLFSFQISFEKNRFLGLETKIISITIYLVIDFSFSCKTLFLRCRRGESCDKTDPLTILFAYSYPESLLETTLRVFCVFLLSYPCFKLPRHFPSATTQIKTIFFWKTF